MSMQSIYSHDEMFDRAVKHLKCGKTTLINQAGVAVHVHIVPGVWIEFGAGLFQKINSETDLTFAAQLAVKYHDSLRSESEQLDIEDHRRAIEDTLLLEEACAARLSEMGILGSDDDDTAA